MGDQVTGGSQVPRGVLVPLRHPDPVVWVSVSDSFSLNDIFIVKKVRQGSTGDCSQSKHPFL